MESHFTVKGQQFVLTAEEVEAALRDVEPQKVRIHGVEIGGRVFPVRQALAVACGIDVKLCFPHVASRVFRQLGFRISSKPSRPRVSMTLHELHKALPHREKGFGPTSFENLELPPLVIQWFPWERWEDLVEYGEAIVDLPGIKSGVYEAGYGHSQERLTIGRANNLRLRVLHGLIRGTSQHTAGREIRKHEDLSRVCVRWGLTRRPAAAEEELHRLHIEKWGRLPKYTVRT
ncbi:MAG: hypothetical protein FJX75_29515 [Armatimonadetes bacterium]|nr:hypothetical protein [Armatimonadota bacterium]